MADEVYAKNTINGLVDLVPRDYLTHPILGENLVEVRNRKPRKSIKDIVDSDAPETQSPETDGETAETNEKEV